GFAPESTMTVTAAHRVVCEAAVVPGPATTQAARQSPRTNCLTDLDRSKAREPDRLSAARLGDPSNRAHGRGSPPLDTPRRSHGRERDHAAPRYTPPALRSRTHLQENPNRQALHA